MAAALSPPPAFSIGASTATATPAAPATAPVAAPFALPAFTGFTNAASIAPGSTSALQAPAIPAFSFSMSGMAPTTPSTAAAVAVPPAAGVMPPRLCVFRYPYRPKSSRLSVIVCLCVFV
jgi:hypothetical protein